MILRLTVLNSRGNRNDWVPTCLPNTCLPITIITIAWRHQEPKLWGQVALGSNSDFATSGWINLGMSLDLSRFWFLN